MFSFHKIIALFFFLMVATLVSAQPDSDLPSEQLEVIKEFEAHLEDSEKLDVKPDLPPLNTNAQQVKYNIPDQNMDIEYLPPTIRPIAMKSEKLADIYSTYLKLGYGIPASPYGELGYNYRKDENYNFGVLLKHHSAKKKDVDFQQFMENYGKLYGSYYFGSSLGADAALHFKNDQVHFYGFNFDPTDSTDYVREDVKQVFNTFGFETELYNREAMEGDLGFKAGTKFARITDRFDSGETNFDLYLDGTKWFSEQYALRLHLGSDFTFFSTQDSTQNLHNFYINPSFSFHKEIFRLKMGAVLAWGAGTFKPFPDIEASANILGKKLAVFAGWQGGFRKNNFQQLTDYNPFLASDPMLKNTSYFHYFGGINGRYKMFNYKAEVGYKPSNELALFLTDNRDNKRFQVLYDTVNIINIAGTITAEPVKNLQIDVMVGQNIYSVKNEEKAWHLPSLESNISLRYTALKKENLMLRAEAYIADAVPVRNSFGETEDLNSLFDISLGAEYFVTKNIGIFVNANNLFNNKRQRWYRYPSYGINLLGGVTARF